MTIVDENIDAGIWPEPFNGGWINIFTSKRGNEVISLYFNNEFEQSTINFNQEYWVLPDAYISVRPNGEIFDLFVRPDMQRRKIGATICAWARSYFLKKDIVISAPEEGITSEADMLYNYLTETYGEPYNEIATMPFFFAYKEFNGGVKLTMLNNWKETNE